MAVFTTFINPKSLKWVFRYILLLAESQTIADVYFGARFVD
jgi:hypothetical protein